MAREARTPEGVWRALVRATAKESPPQGVCCSQTQVLLLSLPGGKSGLLSASSPGIGKAKQKLGFLLPSPPPLSSVRTQSLGKGPFLRIAFLSCLWARAESLSPLCPVAGVSLRDSPRFIDNLVRGSTASPNVPLLPDPGWERGVCTRDSWILMGSIFTFSVERNQPFRKQGTGLRLNENPPKRSVRAAVGTLSQSCPRTRFRGLCHGCWVRLPKCPVCFWSSSGAVSFWNISDLRNGETSERSRLHPKLPPAPICSGRRAAGTQ